MARRIEQLLRVAGDMHRFSAGSSIAHTQDFEELLEEDLDLIAAAAGAPNFQDIHPDKNGQITDLK